MRVGLGIGHLDLPMLWSYSYGYGPGKKRKYRRICCLGIHIYLSRKFVIVVLGLLGIMILSLTFNFSKK